MSIIDSINTAFEKQLPFVAYKKPGATVLSGFFQHSADIFYTENFEESGFVFAPFDATSPVLIPENLSDFISEHWEPKKITVSKPGYEIIKDSKEQYIHLIKKAISKIKGGYVKKIVVSRKEMLKLGLTNGLDIFLNLLSMYDKAMVYLWYHPAIGTWLGATPETLLTCENFNFSTMSLAATQPFEGSMEVTWTSKEAEEQYLVTDFISTQLKQVVGNVNVSGRHTVRAGNVVHLRTLISGKFDNSTGLKDLIHALHPTPAVCGLPRKEARKFIISEEGYDRAFYTGFLGEINVAGHSELYVNLRCMELSNGVASLYVGGGITKDSEPEKEWKETVLKTETLKRALKNHHLSNGLIV